MIREGYHLLNYDYGFLLKKLPQNIYNEVKRVVDEVQNSFSKATPYGHQLAGYINKEYHTKLLSKTIEYIKLSINEYDIQSPNYLSSLKRLQTTPNIILNYEGGCWINFQEKYEYNPIHNHSGVFSYVIWYQIPFYKEDEQKYKTGNDKNTSGQFHFICPEGNKLVLFPLSIDKTMEGHIAIFPSSLNHIVYPFYTSNEYRITISGNIHLQGY